MKKTLRNFLNLLLFGLLVFPTAMIAQAQDPVEVADLNTLRTTGVTG